MEKKEIDKIKTDLVNDKEKTKHWGLITSENAQLSFV